MEVSTINTHTHKHGEVHKHEHKQSRTELAWDILEKISTISLGIFSAYVNFKMFLPSFLAGVGIGAYNYFYDNEGCDHVHTFGSCSQIRGVRLPAPVTIAINFAITICHIDHHSSVFVPVMGIQVGAWAGEKMFNCGSLLYRKIQEHIPRSPAFA